MPKPLALSIAVCLSFTGCQIFEKSETWDLATRVRPGETVKDPDPSNAYAAKLHQTFAEHGVEHKIVTYQYRYTTRLREEAVGTRTAVIYRDSSDSSSPWWVKDDRLNTPVWLPNGTLDKQISFYIRRPAEVIEQKDYPAAGSSGKTVAFAKPQVPAPRPLFVEKLAAVTRIVAAKKNPAPAPVAKPVEKTAIVAAPIPEKLVVKKAPVAPAPITRLAAVENKPAPKPFFSHVETATTIDTTPPPVASSVPAPWSPPAVLAPVEQAREAAPLDERLEKLFRSHHGSTYDRFSPADRRKMEQLRHTLASRE